MHQFFFEKPCYIFSTEGASFIQDFNNFALTIIFLDTSRRFQRFVQKSKTPINDFDIFFHTTTSITTRSNFNSAKEFSAQHYQIFFGTPLKPTKLVCPLVNIIQCFFFLHFSLGSQHLFWGVSQLVGSCVLCWDDWVGSYLRLRNEKKNLEKNSFLLHII